MWQSSLFTEDEREEHSSCYNAKSRVDNTPATFDSAALIYTHLAMAERNIDPGGGEGGGSVEPHDNQSPRNGEKDSDQVTTSHETRSEI